MAGIVLGPRYGGLAVVNRLGPALRPRVRERPGHAPTAEQLAVVTLSLRAARTSAHRRRAVRRLIGRVVRGYRPRLLVVGRIGREGPEHRELVSHVLEAADLHEVAVDVRSVPDARAALLGPGSHREGALASVLARTVCPVLHALSAARGDVQRYRAHAWNALAVTLVAFAERYPWSLAALTDPRALPDALRRVVEPALAHSSPPLP